MLLVGMTMSDSDALRSYITTLRSEQQVSQDAVAAAIGVGLRTYQAWENGETKDIKAPLVIRAMKYLGGAFKHLAMLEDVTSEQAEELAREWIRLSPDQRLREERVEEKFKRVIELGEQDPERLEQVIDRLRADAQADPVVLEVVLAWLDGRRSR